MNRPALAALPTLHGPPQEAERMADQKQGAAPAADGGRDEPASGSVDNPIPPDEAQLRVTLQRYGAAFLGWKAGFFHRKPVRGPNPTKQAATDSKQS